MKKVRNIAGIGVSTLVPRRVAGKIEISLDAEQGFVYSRVDGKTSVGDIFALVPFAESHTTQLLLGLWQAGLIDLPGRERPSATRVKTVSSSRIVSPPPPPPARQKRVGDIPFPKDPEKLPELRPESPRFESQTVPPPRRVAAPFDDDIGLSPAERERIDIFVEGIDEKDAFALLEISPTADARDVKRAYFRLSKEFHPDRYYGKELGPYREKLGLIFRAAKGAFELLSDKQRRAAYEESLKRK